MNIVVVQGVLSKEPIERTLPSGSTVMDWSVSVAVDGAKQTVPVQWTDPAKSVRRHDKGDSVVVLGAVRSGSFSPRAIV